MGINFFSTNFLNSALVNFVSLSDIKTSCNLCVARIERRQSMVVDDVAVVMGTTSNHFK